MCYSHFQGVKLKLRSRAFCWCKLCFCTSNGYFRILKLVGFPKWLAHPVQKVKICPRGIGKRDLIMKNQEPPCTSKMNFNSLKMNFNQKYWISRSIYEIIYVFSKNVPYFVDSTKYLSRSNFCATCDLHSVGFARLCSTSEVMLLLLVLKEALLLECGPLPSINLHVLRILHPYKRFWWLSWYLTDLLICTKYN